MAKRTYTVTREVKPVVQFMTFDRHELERVARIDKNGRKWTDIELLRGPEQNAFRRQDIAMVNLWADEKGTECLDQFCVEPTQSGEPDFGLAGDWMTKAQKDKCREINRLCLEAEVAYDLPKGTLSGYR